MGFLTWVLVGAVSGWIAAKVVSGSGKGFVRNTLLGIAGALIGGFLAGSVLDVRHPVSGFNLSTLAVSVVGAAILLLGGGAWRGERR